MAQNKPYDLGRPLRPMDAWDCRLSAPATASSDGKEPFLYWDYRYQLVINGQLKVRDIELGVNLRKSGREGKIQFFPNITQFKMLCMAISDVALDRVPGNLFKMESMTTFMFGKKLDRPEAKVMLVVGKDEEGVFLGVAQKGRDNVKFHFKPPKMTQLRLASGEVVTNGYVSELSARVRAELWDEHVSWYLKNGYLSDDEVQQAKDKKQADNQRRFSQNQGGGGNSWGGGGNNNNYQQQPQQSSAPAQAPAGGGFDNDIPW